MSSVRAEMEALERERAKLRRKEQILREKERRQRYARCAELGKLALQAGIDCLEDQALLGAFLEIAEHLENNEKVEKWLRSGKAALAKPAPKPRLAVSFEKEPTKKEKQLLKELKFRWNGFRQEFHGRGVLAQIQKKLKGAQANIEVLK